MTDIPTEVSNFFLCMQAGRTGVDALMTLFAEGAVYEEPFTGTPRRHVGKDAIRKAMTEGANAPLKDTRIEINTAAVHKGEIHIAWTCHSPSLPGGHGSGLNRFEVRDGCIQSLITTLNEDGEGAAE